MRYCQLSNKSVTLSFLKSHAGNICFPRKLNAISSRSINLDSTGLCNMALGHFPTRNISVSSEFPILLTLGEREVALEVKRRHHGACFWKSWRHHPQLALTFSHPLPHYPLVCTLSVCTFVFVKLFLCPLGPWWCFELFINRGHLSCCLLSLLCPEEYGPRHSKDLINITVSNHQENCGTRCSIIFINPRQMWPKPPNCGVLLLCLWPMETLPTTGEEEGRNLQAHLEDLLCGWALKIKQWTSIYVLFGQIKCSLHYESTMSHYRKFGN